jgi:replicative DNA helicase
MDEATTGPDVIAGDALTAGLEEGDRRVEQVVLGAMLRWNEAIADVAQVLTAESFYLDAHRRVYQAVATLWQDGKPADLISVADWLHNQKAACRKGDWLEDVGGYAYLAELWEAVAHGGSAAYYAGLVRDKALLRELGRAANAILADVASPTGPADEVLAQAEQRVFRVAQAGLRGEAVTLASAVGEAYDRLDFAGGRGLAVSGVPTGLLAIDDYTAGLQDSELVVVAARPGVGKSALGLVLARNAARSVGPVLVVSLEMSRVELAQRLLCCEAGVNHFKARRGTLGAEESERLGSAGDRLRSYPLRIDDAPSQTTLRIAATARRLKSRDGLRLVVIDYLQLVQPADRKLPRHEQVADVSRRLKILARELEVPVVALAQLNRQSEARTDKKPRLSDLRESGGIEADADVALLLHRPEMHEPGDEHKGVLQVLIAKQRNGPTGEVSLRFLGECQRIEDLDVPPCGE